MSTDRTLTSIIRTGLLSIAAAVLLTVTNAHAQSPAQPKIAFERNGAIYVMNADGTGETLLNQFGFDPAFSPDGTKIAYRCGDGDVHNYICVMNADGSNIVALTEDGRSFDPAWSPDGTKIAFTRETNFGTQIYVVNADGSGTAAPLFADAVGDEFRRSPAFSPDGTKIAYTEGYDFDSEQDYIYVRPVDGSAPARRVTSTQRAEHPAFSPDGVHIVYSTLTSIVRVGANPPVDEQGQPVITTDTIYSGGDINAEPAYSPDGTKIAFFHENVTTTTDPFGNTETVRTSGIYVRDDNGALSSLLAAGGGDPSFQGTSDDPEPETPAQRIKNLMALVASFNLHHGTTNSLTVKLRAALAAAEAGDTATACARLADFINHTSAQAGKKLTAAQAEQLIAEAASIRTALGCQ